MRHHAAETTGDCRKKLTQIEIRNERMGYLQQQLRAVAFTGQFLLVTLCLDGDGYLPRQQSGEFKIDLIVNAGYITPKINHPELLISGSQGKAAYCFYGMIWKRFGERKPIVQVNVMNHDWLLMFPNPASDRAFHWDFGW